MKKLVILIAAALVGAASLATVPVTADVAGVEVETPPP